MWQALIVVTIASFVICSDTAVSPDTCRVSNNPTVQFFYILYLQQYSLYITNSCPRYLTDYDDKRQVRDTRYRLSIELQLIYGCFENYFKLAQLVERCNQTVTRLGLTFSTPAPRSTVGTTTGFITVT